MTKINENSTRAAPARRDGPPPADPLAELVVARAETYLRDLEGNAGLPLHDMVQQAVERPLLRWAMERCRGCQKDAARLLGLNRNTLRKKLLSHGLLP